MKSAIILLLGLLTSSAFAQGYPILCRGGFSYQLNGPMENHITINFKANATAAGISGRELVVGHCAWEDRPLNGSEPKSFIIPIDYMEKCQQTATSITCNQQKRMYFDQVISMFKQCATAENCVLRAVVTNINGRFQLDSNFPNVSISSK